METEKNKNKGLQSSSVSGVGLGVGILNICFQVSKLTEKGDRVFPKINSSENSHGQRSLVGYSPWDRRVGHNWATKHSTQHRGSHGISINVPRSDGGLRLWMLQRTVGRSPKVHTHAFLRVPFDLYLLLSFPLSLWTQFLGLQLSGLTLNAGTPFDLEKCLTI